MNETGPPLRGSPDDHIAAEALGVETSAGGGMATVLESYLNQVEQCLAQELYYPALALALALPDICAGLAGRPEKRNTDRYIAWLRENPLMHTAIDASAVVALRHAFLHNGTGELGDQGRQPTGSFVLRRPPSPCNGIRVHSARGMADGTAHGQLDVEVEELVRALVFSARTWSARNTLHLDEGVRAGYLLLVQPPT